MWMHRRYMHMEAFVKGTTLDLAKMKVSLDTHDVAMGIIGSREYCRERLGIPDRGVKAVVVNREPDGSRRLLLSWPGDQMVVRLSVWKHCKRSLTPQRSW